MCLEERPTATESATQVAKIKTLGNYFGYPECCISAFVADLETQQPPAARKLDNSGFIPCPSCRQKIINRQVTLSGLIRCRKASTQFPREIQRETDQYLEGICGNC